MNHYKEEWNGRLTKEPFLQRNFTDGLMRNVEEKAMRHKKKNYIRRNSVFVALGGVLALILFLVIVPYFKSNQPDHLSSDVHNLKTVSYSTEQLDQIKNDAVHAGISLPLLPTISVEGDKLNNIQKGTDSLMLEYTNMTITLYAEPFASPDAYKNDEQKIKSVKLNNGTDGFWMYDNDYLPSKRKFRFTINNVSIQLQDQLFLPEDQVQAIAESFARID